MKRRFLWIVMLVLMTTGCSRTVHYSTWVLNITDLQQRDQFGWKDLTYGMTLEEVEDLLQVEFQKIPYQSEEWKNGRPLEDQLHDYRNDYDYTSVQYTVYHRNYPVQIRYENVIGHMICIFQHGYLTGVIYRFSDQYDTRDPKMTYGGETYDIEELTDQLMRDIQDEYSVSDESIDGLLFRRWNRGRSTLTLSQPKENTHIVELLIQWEG